MNVSIRIALGTALVAALLPVDSHAINAAYRKKLERSGCTQVSEMQGCDINKTKAENAKAGFVKDAAPAATGGSPYAGHWLARSNEGAQVAKIEIDAKDHVLVDGKKVSAKRSDGALVFTVGMITYTIQGDRRAASDDQWHDRDAGTSGPIVKE